MTSDLETVLSDGFRGSVEANLDRDPIQIALDRSIPHAALVATQVKYLHRARHKLPSYYAARCILPALAFQQSSSERTAARKNYSGTLAIDLTCGLGVDSLYLSKKFARVIAIERNPELAAIACENFRRLGAHNIEVVNASTEEFCAEKDLKADLMYADPDRRAADGRKLVRLEDCSPDIAALLPRLRQISPRLVVKLSPLFDVDEVFRYFGPHTRTEVVSMGDECKEIVVETSADIATPTVRIVAIGLGEAEFPAAPPASLPASQLANPSAGSTATSSASTSAGLFEPETYRYLIIPDVALQKARLARQYFTAQSPKIYTDSDNGYGFSIRKPENILGKVLEISSIETFDPKALKRRLKTDGIRNIDILKRSFPLSATEIARRLAVREGGTTAIAFTAAAGKLWQIVIER